MTDKPTTLPANATLDQRLEAAQRTLKEQKLEDLAQAVSQARAKLPIEGATVPMGGDDDKDAKDPKAKNGDKAAAPKR